MMELTSIEMKRDLQRALYPNGVKHPQQLDWHWMIKRVEELAEKELSDVMA